MKMKKVFLPLLAMGIAGIVIFSACGGNGYDDATGDSLTEAGDPVANDLGHHGGGNETTPPVQGIVQEPPPQSTGLIFLYGEEHLRDHEEMLARQLERWGYYYNTHGMRHLFLEKPFYTGEFLNQWLYADNEAEADTMMLALVDEGAVSPFHAEHFFGVIRRDFPDTVFHGVNIGGMWNVATGQRFLAYLISSGQSNTARYELTRQNIAQAEMYSRTWDDGLPPISWIRDKADNFVRAFDALGGESVMGIFNTQHTEFGNHTQLRMYASATLATRLQRRYGDAVSSVNLQEILQQEEWYRIAEELIESRTITLNDIDYEATLLSDADLSGEDLFIVRSLFFRLENAYENLRHSLDTGGRMAFVNFPVEVEHEQIYVMAQITEDGFAWMRYFRTSRGVGLFVRENEDGTILASDMPAYGWDFAPMAVEFTAERRGFFDYFG